MPLKRSISRHCMINRNSLYSSLLLIAFVAFFSSCTLEEPDATDKTPPLTLTAEQNLSLTKLTWDHVNVTGFKEYILLQSSSSIPDNPTPVVNQDVSLVARIKDVDITTTSVSASLITPTVCYKLYCAVDDRFMYSPTICIQQNIEFVPGFFDSGCHTSGIDEMVGFDRANNLLASINYKTATISSSEVEFSFNFPSLDLSTWNGITDVFGFDQSSATLKKFTYPSLINTQNVNFNQILWAAKPYQEFVFIASDEFGKGFKVLRRSNLSKVDEKEGVMNSQNIAVFPGDPVTVITFGVTKSKKYTIDADGKILSEQDVSGRLFQPGLQATCAQGHELFIADALGSIFNRNGDKVGSLGNSQNSFIQLIRLSADETKAIFIANENGTQRLHIADLTTLPAVTLLKSFDLPTLNYADIIPENEIIHVVGASFNNSQPLTYILLYPM